MQPQKATIPNQINRNNETKRVEKPVSLISENKHSRDQTNDKFVKSLMSTASNTKPDSLTLEILKNIVENSLDPEKHEAISFYIFRKFGKEQTLKDIRVLKLLRILLYLMLFGNEEILGVTKENEHLVQGFMSGNQKRQADSKK